MAETMLGAGGDVDDVGNVAAFAASDQPRTISGSTINIACGTTVDFEDRRAGPSPFRVNASAHPRCLDLRGSTAAPWWAPAAPSACSSWVSLG
jgi:hypothetical protein